MNATEIMSEVRCPKCNSRSVDLYPQEGTGRCRACSERFQINVEQGHRIAMFLSFGKIRKEMVN